jgi:hypothetical protein
MRVLILGPNVRKILTKDSDTCPFRHCTGKIRQLTPPPNWGWVQDSTKLQFQCSKCYSEFLSSSPEAVSAIKLTKTDEQAWVRRILMNPDIDGFDRVRRKSQ